MAHYHFVGIKDFDMSSLAQIMHDLGHEVQRSDIENYVSTKVTLRNRGIKILPFDANNIKGNMVVIQDDAFASSHKEIVHTHRLKLDVISYNDFLGQIIDQYTSVAVTGTHGKTSTIGLLSHAMNGDKETSFLIGDGTGMGLPESDYFAFEACEYRRHFLSYKPDYAIMTNIDFDHSDYFKDISDVFDASQEMARNAKKGIIAWGDDEHLRKVEADVPVYYYRFRDSDDIYAQNIQIADKDTAFDVYVDGEFYDHLLSPQYGSHTTLNALAVIATSYLEKLDVTNIKEALETFGGAKRRFDETTIANQVIVDDYTHHPREISATIETVRGRYPHKEVVAVFQPHTFSRTQAFLSEFTESLSKADRVFLCEILGSIRENTGALAIQDLTDKVEGASLVNEDSINVSEQFDNAVILFIGAGDIQKSQNVYLDKLGTKNTF